ncbi:MAG TPA: HD domain-containing protein [Candidatus Deferrimicrobiaceae bacterium]|jgi:tRNA nucleotidyltransferase (CCA-adding enzyme)
MEGPIEFARSLFPPRMHDRIFLVGGVVRDRVLGLEGEDLDLLAAIPPDELVRSGFRLVEAKSATPIYFRHLPPIGKIEVAPLDSPDSIPVDLRRRDFTANAMAMDLCGTLIDPLGGKPDALALRLRACSPGAFLDDSVRVFRAFRFEASGWRMMPETEALLRESVQAVPDVFSGIPNERFSREMVKALGAADPARFFLQMVAFGAGTEFLPELFRMPRVPAGSLTHHPEGDLFTHSSQVLQRMAGRSSDPLARFCAFFHDLGKLSTDPMLHPKHHGHEEAGAEASIRFCNRLRLPAEWRRALLAVCRHHGSGHRWRELRDATRVTIAQQALAAGAESILPLVCDADRDGESAMAGWSDALRVARMGAAELGIPPEQIESLAPADRGPFILQRRVEALRQTRPAT